jgi:hypothetical protein
MNPRHALSLLLIALGTLFLLLGGMGLPMTLSNFFSGNPHYSDKDTVIGFSIFLGLIGLCGALVLWGGIILYRRCNYYYNWGGDESKTASSTLPSHPCLERGDNESPREQKMLPERGDIERPKGQKVLPEKCDSESLKEQKVSRGFPVFSPIGLIVFVLFSLGMWLFLSTYEVNWNDKEQRKILFFWIGWAVILPIAAGIYFSHRWRKKRQ